MECPKKVVFGFDPKDKPMLDNPKVLIIWACIKSGHITNQYFDENVADFVDWLELANPQTYAEFKQMLGCHDLSKFGTKMRMKGNFETFPEIDDSFWEVVWSYIRGDAHLKIEFNYQQKSGAQNGNMSKEQQGYIDRRDTDADPVAIEIIGRMSKEIKRLHEGLLREKQATREAWDLIYKNS